MVEFKPCRVQALTVDELSVLSKNGAALASIQGITEHGMPYEGHMHAYLVRSAGLKSAYRKGRTVVAFADIPMRYGFARVQSGRRCRLLVFPSRRLFFGFWNRKRV